MLLQHDNRVIIKLYTYLFIKSIFVYRISYIGKTVSRLAGKRINAKSHNPQTSNYFRLQVAIGRDVFHTPKY